MRNICIKYTFCVIIPNFWDGKIVFHKLGIQFSTISTNINNNFPVYSTRPFVNYFVPNISSTHDTA
jgi:hypothetical protein